MQRPTVQSAGTLGSQRRTGTQLHRMRDFQEPVIAMPAISVSFRVWPLVLHRIPSTEGNVF